MRGPRGENEKCLKNSLFTLELAKMLDLIQANGHIIPLNEQGLRVSLLFWFRLQICNTSSDINKKISAKQVFFTCTV